MTVFAQNTSKELRYCKETVFGETPLVPDMKVMRKALLPNTFNDNIYYFKCEVVDEFITTL